jgi:hypothetical protein
MHSNVLLPNKLLKLFSQVAVIRQNAGLTVVVKWVVAKVGPKTVAAQHAIPPGARLAAAVRPSMRGSRQDVVRQTNYGMMLETAVPLPGGTSKTPLIAKFVLGGGIQAGTGPSIKVPELV